MNNIKYNKSLFQWAGGKGKALKHVLPILEKYKEKILVEPFIGAANISLNFDTESYIWNDVNTELMNTYRYLLSSERNVEYYKTKCQEVFSLGYGDHIKLKELSKNSKHTAIISNHWTDFTKELYKDADELYTFEVQRTISCDGGGRKKVEEVVAVYLGDK